MEHILPVMLKIEKKFKENKKEFLVGDVSLKLLKNVETC